MLLSEMLRHSARVRPARLAVVDDERSLTYAEVAARAARLANALRDGYGLAAGDRVVVLATNRAEFAEIYFGVGTASLVSAPVNPRLAAPEIASIVTDAEPRLVIAERGMEEKVDGLVEAGYSGPVVWLSRDEPGDYEEVLAAASSRPPQYLGSPSDAALLMYTSGSTGLPKGVVLSHANIAANSWHLLAEDSVVASDRYLNCTPLSHLGAGSRVIMLVHAGSTHVIHRTFDGERILSEALAGRVNAALVVPAMMREFLDASVNAGTSLRGRFRQITYGAAPMPVDLLTESLERLGCDFQQGYGLTEAGHNLTLLQPEDHRPAPNGTYSERLGSVGRETIGMHVRIVGEHDDDVAPGTVGEVIARGPNLMQGYWRQPEETAIALRGGWLRTGDLGTCDEDGYVYLVDRKKDMLVSGGYNVYPREIERHLERHPDVHEVAIVGGPHERWGEVPVAFVVAPTQVDAAQLELALREICERELARYKQPARYCFVERLPHTSTGKVSKPQLRQKLQPAEPVPGGQEVGR